MQTLSRLNDPIVDNYRETRAAAQADANRDGFDRGVERTAFGWRAFMLPRRENRYGFELRCEVVSCEDLAKCPPGHGPTMVRR